jgi:hypothetical protein
MALYNSKGTISYISEVSSGTSRSGNTWQRLTLHLDIPGFQGAIFKQVFQASGNAVYMVKKYKVGDRVEVSFSLYAREWDGKWYNNVDLVHIAPADAKAEDPGSPAPEVQDNPNNDLPF